jgi:hypothetical protein
VNSASQSCWGPSPTFFFLSSSVSAHEVVSPVYVCNFCIFGWYWVLNSGPCSTSWTMSLALLTIRWFFSCGSPIFLPGAGGGSGSSPLSCQIYKLSPSWLQCGCHHSFSGWLVYLQFLQCCYCLLFRGFFLFFPWVGVSLSRGLCWSGPGLSVGVLHTA